MRTGSPIRPATASAQYLDGVNALTGSMLHGLYGLFLSPNRGVFLFSPILLLSVVALIRWRRLDRELRQLLAIHGAGAAGYVLLISKMANWGTFGGALCFAFGGVLQAAGGIATPAPTRSRPSLTSR